MEDETPSRARMWTSSLNKQGPYLRVAGRDATAAAAPPRRRPFSLDYSTRPAETRFQGDVDPSTGISVTFDTTLARRSSAGAEENSFVLRNRNPQPIPPPPPRNRRRAHTAEPRRPDKIFGERLTSRLAQKAKQHKTGGDHDSTPRARASVDEDHSRHDLARSDSFLSRARRAFTGPAILRHGYVDRDASGRNAARFPSSRYSRDQSKRSWSNTRAFETRIKELESELAAANMESSRMANIITELQEENAQTKGAVPILEDVLTRARQQFETKERALKQMIAKLHSELAMAVQEKNDIANILNQYGRGRNSKSHSGGSSGPRSLGSYPFGIPKPLYLSRPERKSLEALAGESTAARRIEELEKLSGPLLSSYEREDGSGL